MKDQRRRKDRQTRADEEHAEKEETTKEEDPLRATDGPPPPPPGTAATTAMGYDVFDLEILEEVGSYRFGSIAAGLSNDGITVPSHPATTFDEEKFLRILRGSISITGPEKWRVLQAVSTLDQSGINSVIDLLEEELRNLQALSPKHLKELQNKERVAAEEWRDLQIRGMTRPNDAKESL